MHREEYFWYRWQIIRRDPTYIEFCNDHDYTFYKEYPQILDESSLGEVSLRQKVENIKKRFGLEVIYHPSVGIPKEYILSWPVFEKERAVDYENREMGFTNLFSPLWNDHNVKLTIDISRTDSQITRDTFEIINWAREIAGTEGKRLSFKNLDKVFKVWDLHEKGKMDTEIIKEVWPEEYERECLEKSGFSEARESREVSAAVYERDMKFRKLREEYEKQGLPNYEEKAWTEVFGDENQNSSGCIKLYMRVKDNQKRMESLFLKVRED